MNTRLKWVSLTAFRSFVERTVIRFPESGLVSIRGFNLDSKGSSGSGKSSVNLAIAYALGICPFPATALQSWLTDAPMAVELCLETAQGEVIITRGEKFTLSINGDVKKGNAKALEEKLRQILGLPPELLEALTYRKQMSRGMFLSKTNAEKQEFLTILLGLDKFEAAIEKTQANIRELEPSAKLLAEDVALRAAAVECQAAAIGNLELLDEIPLRLELDKAKQQIVQYEEQIQAKKQSIAKAEREIQERTAQITLSHVPRLQTLEREVEALRAAPIPEPDRTEEILLNKMLDAATESLRLVCEKDQLALVAERAHARGLQGQLDGMRRNAMRGEQLKADGRKRLEQIAILEKNVCPTCSQRWTAAATEKKKLEGEVEKIATELQALALDSLVDEIGELEEAVQVAWKHIPCQDIERFRSEQARLMHEASDAEAHNANLLALAAAEKKQKVVEGEARLKSARASAIGEAQTHQINATERLGGIRGEVEELQNALRAANAHLAGCQNAALVASLRNAEAKQKAATEVALLEEARRALAALRSRAQAASQELSAERDFLSLAGREGFLGAVLGEVLWEIGDEANRILGNVPNVNHVTVQFKSESLTLKGKIVKEINPVCLVGGHEAPLKAGLSGGMYSAVELAVDLAVGTVVARRTGAMPQWLILDESFTGLGASEVEAVLEVLRVCAAEKLVLLVSHETEVKDAGVEHLDIEYRNGYSTVRG